MSDSDLKKNLSTLKKALLRERLNYFSSDLILVDFALGADSDDFEERTEIISNARSLCEEFGALKTVLLQENDRDILVSFENGRNALEAFQQLQTRSIQGVPISVQRIQGEIPKTNGFLPSARIKLVNFLENCDLNDPLEMMEIVDNIIKICSPYGRIEEIVTFPPKISVVVEFSSVETATEARNCLRKIYVNGKRLTVKYFFGDQTTKSKDMSQYDKPTWLVFRDFLDGVNCGDDDELNEIKRNLVEFCHLNDVNIELNDVSLKIDRLSASVRFRSLQEAANACNSLRDKIIGGNGVLIDLIRLRQDEIKDDDEECKEVDRKHPIDVDDNDDDGGSRKFARRDDDNDDLPSHEAKTTSTLSSKLPPFNVSDFLHLPVMSDEVLHKVKEMINLVAQRQAYKRKTGAATTGYNRIMVTGLREIQRGVRAKNVKLVVFSTEMEDSDTLKSIVNQIHVTARENEIPVLVGFTRRSLAAAIHRELRVSSIGIYEFDGAHQEKKQLFKLLNIK